MNRQQLRQKKYHLQIRNILLLVTKRVTNKNYYMIYRWLLRIDCAGVSNFGADLNMCREKQVTRGERSTTRVTEQTGHCGEIFVVVEVFVSKFAVSPAVNRAHPMTNGFETCGSWRIEA